MSNTETYPEKVDRIAAELLDVLRDSLGPGRRLPEARADYARYGDHSVTVRDGENGRVEVTAHLTDSGSVREYSARLTRGDRGRGPRTAVGPLRMDCSEDLEEHPTLTYVLPLIIRLGLAEARVRDAMQALSRAGFLAEHSGSRIVLREARPWGSYATATVELDPDNGSLHAHGRDAAPVREVLRRAKIF
jgi:hypothetical protein